MSWTNILGASAIIGLYALALPQLKKLWRNESGRFDRPPSMWPTSEPVWRGYVRALPTIVFGFLLLIVGAIPMALFAHRSPTKDRFGFVISPVIAFGYLALVAAVAGLVGTIVFFNWPRQLVPPARRGEAGALKSLRQARRRRKEMD